MTAQDPGNTKLRISEKSSGVNFRGATYTLTKNFWDGTHRACAPVDTLAAIRPFLKRAGVTRIADITGLDHIGVPTTLALRPNAQTMACSSGKGVTLDQAYVSGAMEAFELYAAETTALQGIQRSFSELSDECRMPPASDLPLSRWDLFNPNWPHHWHLGWDLIGQCETPVPLVCVGMSRNVSLMSSVGAFTVSSNGLGAGNSFLEALAAGLYEVIERDGVACHYYRANIGSHAIPILPEHAVRAYPLVSDVLDHCDRSGARVVVYDCTVDTGVPTYDALVYDSTYSGVGVIRGSGAHLDPGIALLRAITEALQGRLNYIAGSRDDIFRSAFGRIHVTWREMVENIGRILDESPPAFLRRNEATDTFHGDIGKLIYRLEAVGLQHVVVTDLSPPDFPVSIVRVTVPGLEGYMHHGYRPGRRAKQFAETAQ